MNKETFERMYRIEKYHWWFRVRREIVCYFLGDVFGKKILDLGAGTGLLAEELERRGAELFAVDSSKDAMAFCVSRGLKNVIEADALNLPFVNGYFDIVLSLDILEHIQEDALVVKEISRVLKKEGILIVTVPAMKILWTRQDEMLGHFRRYSLSNFKKLFSEWEVRRLSYFNFLLFIPIFFTRQFFRLFKINDEIEVGGGWSNKILYNIFKLEVPFLKRCKFPFGVSIFGYFTRR